MVASLRARVTSWYVGLLAISLVVFGACIYFGVQRYLEASLQRSLASEARSIANTFVDEFETKGNTWLAQELSESYPQSGNAQVVRVSRLESGDKYQVLYPLADAGEGSSERLTLPPAVHLKAPEFRSETGSDAAPLVVYAFPYKSGSGAPYLIEVAVSHAPIAQLLRNLLMLLVILTPVILVAAGFGGYLMMTQPLKPVVSLTLKAERIGVAEFGERLPVIPTGDELERLSHSLNRMITRLEDALDHNRRFSADVSHELRTPLTILRGELEHVIQLPDLRAEVIDSVGSALEEIERLAKIVESLLAISRLDSGGAGIEHHPLDLAALSRMTADQMQLLASEKQISLTCESTGSVQAIGDETRIKQVLVNLLDNAIKYTRTNGHVVVSVEAQGNSALLTVTDDGVGIPAESLPHVFERFYRAEKARSRGCEGFGLGLSLVEAVCRAHGGEASIESTEGQGTTVRVRLPLPDAPWLAVNGGRPTLPSPDSLLTHQ
jgi:two-component system OmpR family sensor kinase